MLKLLSGYIFLSSFCYPYCKINFKISTFIIPMSSSNTSAASFYIQVSIFREIKEWNRKNEPPIYRYLCNIHILHGFFSPYTSEYQFCYMVKQVSDSLYLRIPQRLYRFGTSTKGRSSGVCLSQHCCQKKCMSKNIPKTSRTLRNE